MSEVDVSLYANDVGGLLGEPLSAVEAAVKKFMDDGERVTSYQFIDFIPLFSGVTAIRYV